MAVSAVRVSQSENHQRWTLAFALFTIALVAVFVLGVASRAVEDPASPGPTVASLAMTATVILLLAFAIPTAFLKVDVQVTRWWPWLVGGVSGGLALLGWALVVISPATGAAVYRAIRLPQGIVQFWDLRLTLETVDCSRWGFDVFQENNGCLADPSIYGPGITWWRFGFGVLSEPNTTVLGVLLILVTSGALLWVARRSSGLAAVVLVVAAAGAPWQLMLERANIDALILVIAVLAVWLTSRWSTYWAWALAAAGIWTAGTWKYYPFVLAVLLLPALRLRRGWIVLAGFVTATAVFFVLTWNNVLLSLAASSGMADLGDYVVLGRIPIIARLPEVWGFGDFLFAAICVAAIAWGVFLGRVRQPLASSSRIPVWVLLALAGALLYLSSVALTGFAYGYKAAFLVLLIPGLRIRAQLPRAATWSTLVAVALLVISFVVVWNTVLATLAGVVAAGISLGTATYVLLRRWRSRSAPQDSSIPARQGQDS